MLSPTIVGSPIRFAAELTRALDRYLRRGSAAWLILVASSLTGCWSSRITSLDGLDLFLRFRVDGTLVEYTSLGNVFGLYTDYPGTHVLNVVAWDSTSGLRLRVSSRQGSPGPGTHSIAQSVNDPTLRLNIYYQDPAGTGYSAQPVVPEDATIMISHVGSTTIGGTFFGVVKAPGRPDVTIADGEFMVRREFDITVRR